jgi:uncharacterized repeat protein (TIGR03803 family)
MQHEVRVLLVQFVTAVAAFIVFLTLQGQAQTEKIIYSFSGGADGADPMGGLIVDANGNLYGVTPGGGTNYGGTVFELTPSTGGTWSKSLLYSFNPKQGDVSYPDSNLVFDAKGNLYGICFTGGGANGAGGIFELSPGSNGTWNEKVIYSFVGGVDSIYIGSPLTIDGAGNLYGYHNAVYGSIFELQPGSNGTWTEKTLHTFSGGNDGTIQYGDQLSVDASGNLYGQARVGPHDFGIVFELVRGPTGSWTEKILYTFTGGVDGSAGVGSRILRDANSNLFGVSSWNVFELMPGSNGSWTEKVLHTFTGGSDGAYPESGLTIDASGKLYGATYEGGGAHRGTVFELTPAANGSWTEKILHRFTRTGGDGAYPSFLTLAIDEQGNLYGTTLSGGTSNFGVVFEVTP